MVVLAESRPGRAGLRSEKLSIEQANSGQLCKGGIYQGDVRGQKSDCAGTVWGLWLSSVMGEKNS